MSRWVTWVYACAPAAVGFHLAGIRTWVPWASAFALVMMLAPALERLRYARERDRYSGRP
jgi:hypothetical protein